MSDQKAIWAAPGVKRQQTGTWTYNRSGGYFVIHLDSRDPVTGEFRLIRSYEDKPEWGNYRLVEKTNDHQ